VSELLGGKIIVTILHFPKSSLIINVKFHLMRVNIKNESIELLFVYFDLMPNKM
jgi:hypothetical protein